MLLDVFSAIINAFGEVVSNIGIGLFAVVGLSLTLLVVIISFVVTQFSIEIKTARAVARLNKYLELNPFITEENLVEFNALMKRIPQPMRVQWQQYMVNRDKKPSEFFTDSNCIEKPFKASAYASQIVAVKVAAICISVLMFIFNMAYYNYIGESSLLGGLLSSLLVSAMIVFVASLYVLFLKARRNSAISEVYFSFNAFQKYIDRACGTLPEYVDYEILFTRSEITKGIPVLQEYLQQRALFEQEEIKRAKESQVEHDNYDFSALGINGSLVMERAMRESEYVIGNKRRILAEISELEGSRDMLDKSYDEKNKNSQRKLRDIQESLDRLKEKLDSTTNLIVGNDLRKQRENEIQKQRQLEKEAEEDNKKYEADRKQLNEQIDAKRGEIDQYRQTAESALNGEFKTYADKIYNELRKEVEAQVKDEVDNLRAEKLKLEQELEERERLYIEKSTVLDEKSSLAKEYGERLKEQDEAFAEAEKIKHDFDQYSSTKDKEIFNAKKEIESKAVELDRKNQLIEKQSAELKELKKKKQVVVERYFDVNGNEFFYDGDGNPYTITPNGEKVYYSNQQGNVVETPVENNEQKTDQLEPADAKNEGTLDLGDGNIDLGFQDSDLIYEKPKTEQVVNEPVTEPTEENVEPAETTAEKPAEAPVEKPAEQSTEATEETEGFDIISQLDKLIEEQNAELEKQNQTLSEQLEKTKQEVEKDIDDSGEVAKTKKSRSKKNTQTNKKSNTNKSNSKKSSKTTGSKKEKTKRTQNKKEKPDNQGNADDTGADAGGAFEFDLGNFNDMLNEAIQDIDDSNK